MITCINNVLSFHQRVQTVPMSQIILICQPGEINNKTSALKALQRCVHFKSVKFYLRIGVFFKLINIYKEAG